MSTPDDVSKKLDALHTALLGIPGTEEKGFIGDMKAYLAKQDSRLTVVEKEIDRHISEEKGMGRVIHYGLTVAISAVSGFAARYLK